MRAIERRSYLRIGDDACIEAMAISEEKAKQYTAEVLMGADKTFSLRKQLYKLELEARELQREVAEMDRALGSFLHNLNQRMDILSEVISGTTADKPANVIDLSPAGVAYLSDTLYPANDLVAIKMTLMNESFGFACFGRVSYGLIADNDQYRIGVQFVTPDPTLEALITRHIAARQAEERRKRLHGI